MDGKLILAGEAARRLAVTLTTLTDWERAGILQPAMRLGPWRLRVYNLQDVERLAAEREAKKASGNGQGRRPIAAAGK